MMVGNMGAVGVIRNFAALARGFELGREHDQDVTVLYGRNDILHTFL